MTQSPMKEKDTLKLTREEAESMGVELPEAPALLPESVRERTLHEQVDGPLTEGDVVEALSGEVTPETREELEDAFADLEEEAEDNQRD